MAKKVVEYCDFYKYRLYKLFSFLTFDEKLFFLRLVILYSYYKFKQISFYEGSKKEFNQKIQENLEKNTDSDAEQEKKFANVVLTSIFQNEDEDKKVYQKIVTIFDAIERILFFPLKSDDNIFNDLQSNYNGIANKVKLPIWLKLNCLNDAIIAGKKRIDYLTNYDDLEPLTCEARYQDLLTFKDVVENFKDLHQLLTHKISFFDVILFIITNISENNNIYIELNEEQVSKFKQLLKQRSTKKLADLLIQKADKNYLNFNIFINFFTHITTTNIHQTNKQIIDLVREIILQQLKMYGETKLETIKKEKNSLEKELQSFLEKELQSFITVIEKTEVVLQNELQLVLEQEAAVVETQLMRATAPIILPFDIKKVIDVLAQFKTVLHEDLLLDFIFDDKAKKGERNLAGAKPVSVDELLAVNDAITKVKNEVEKVAIAFEDEYKTSQPVDRRLKKMTVALEENLDGVMAIVEEARGNIKKARAKVSNNKIDSGQNITEIDEQTNKKLEQEKIALCDFLTTVSNSFKKFMFHVTTEKVPLRINLEKVLLVIEKVINQIENRKKIIIGKLLTEFLNFNSNITIKTGETKKMEFLQNELEQLLSIVTDDWFAEQIKIVEVKKLAPIKTASINGLKSILSKQKLLAQQGKKKQAKKNKKKLPSTTNLAVMKTITPTKPTVTTSVNKQENVEKSLVKQQNLKQENVQKKQKKNGGKQTKNVSSSIDTPNSAAIDNLTPAVKDVIAAANADFAPWTQTTTNYQAFSKAEIVATQNEIPTGPLSSSVITSEKANGEIAITNELPVVTSELPQPVVYSREMRNKKLMTLKKMLKNRDNDVQFLQQENFFLKELIFYLEQAQKYESTHSNVSLEQENIVLKQIISVLEQKLEQSEVATTNMSLEHENEKLKEHNLLLAQGLSYLQATLQNQPIPFFERLVEKNTVTIIRGTNHDLVETTVISDDRNNSVVARRVIGEVMEVVNQQTEVVVHPVNVSLVANPVAVALPVVVNNNFNSCNANGFTNENSNESSINMNANHAFL